MGEGGRRGMVAVWVVGAASVVLASTVVVVASLVVVGSAVDADVVCRRSRRCHCIPPRPVRPKPPVRP